MPARRMHAVKRVRPLALLVICRQPRSQRLRPAFLIRLVDMTRGVRYDDWALRAMVDPRVAADPP